MPKPDRGARARTSTWRQRRRIEAAAAVALAPDALLPRLHARSIAMFFGLAVLLLAPWPGYGRLFGPLFCAFGNGVIVVVGVGGDSEPRFSTDAQVPATLEAGTTDWTVWLAANRGNGSSRPPLPLETKILGYTPLALLLAVTLALAAVSWRRKLRMLGIGLALLLIRLAVAIALPVGCAFRPHPAAPGPIIEIVWYVLIDLPAMSYAAPLFAWWIAFAATRD